MKNVSANQEVAELVNSAAEIKANMEKYRLMAGAQVRTLLELREFFSEDLIGQLEDAAKQLPVPVEYVDAGIYTEQEKEPVKNSYGVTIKTVLAEINTKLDIYNPEVQREVLQQLMADMPRRLLEEAEEAAKEKAIDRMLNGAFNDMTAAELSALACNIEHKRNRKKIKLSA